MKYIDFESWTITWLHEGNVIVEDQLTHNFKRRSHERLSVDDPSGISADSAAIYEHCEQASSERL